MSDLAYTVVIPAFNAQKYIGETLQSVLAQTVQPLKIIVVDDGSVDATAQIAKGYHPIIDVISTENRGAGAATTTGIDRVQTPFIATIDSDDLWASDKMAKQLALLSDSKLALDAILCRLRPFGEVSKKTATLEHSGWSRSTMTIRTDAFLKVGPIKDMGNGYGEMVDWFARAKQAGVIFHMIDEALADRRIHNESISFNANQGQTADLLKAAVRAVERHRRAK